MRQTTIFLTLLLLSLSSSLAHAQIIPERYYKIVSRSSGKCLDLVNHGTENGVRLQQWDCTGENHQIFRVADSGWNAGNAFLFVGKDSGRCVEVNDFGTDEEATIQQADCVYSNNQIFLVDAAADGYYRLRSSHSDMCLVFPGPSQANGVEAKQSVCDQGLSNQDWKFVEVLNTPTNPPVSGTEPAPIEIPENNIRILIDNSDETFASARLFHVKDNYNVSYKWKIYSNGAVSTTLDDDSPYMDLTRLGSYTGMELGVTVVADGFFVDSANRIPLDAVVAGPLHKETITAQKAGTGLLGTPIIRRLNFTFETYQVGCKKKTVISWNGVKTEEECDFRRRPKEFAAEELKTLKAAAVTAFKSMMAVDTDGKFLATQCAVNAAASGHGAFSLAPGAALAYSNDNAAKVWDTQLTKWDIFGKIEDFNIHFRINHSTKPRTVIGHAKAGAVLDNFDHSKLYNTDKNRFEIHMSRLWLPPTASSMGQVVWQDRDGNSQTSTTSLRESAGTIAHEMAHQMGIMHTVDPNTNADFQDDFVYSIGNCVEMNFISDPDWNDTVAF